MYFTPSLAAAIIHAHATFLDNPAKVMSEKFNIGVNHAKINDKTLSRDWVSDLGKTVPV